MPTAVDLSYARTKIQVPRFRASMIERSDLEARLDEALLSRRLVLLIAAAGYGKTAALARQLMRLPATCATAWITVDEHDDLPRFLACLVDALEAHDPPWRVAPESLVERVWKEAGLGTVIDELVNVLSAMTVEHGVIALDDMHLITDPRVFEFLQLLVERAPPNWTIAIAARTQPPLPLARLRARRELMEFGPADLSFSLQEIRLLSSAAGLDEDEQIARNLQERTQGWVAGLCLTLDVLDRSGAPAQGQRVSRRHLFEYLASEVFESMSTSWREFLMRCSVLPELTAARCAKVSGNMQAARMLEEIERHGIFISALDSREFTLRQHDLFREFLNDRLRREHPEEIPQLLRRAAEDETDPARKIDMLLRSGERHEAEELLHEVAPILLAHGGSARVMRLIEQFPAATQASSPRLAFTRGLVAWAGIDPAAAKSMNDAAIAFEREGNVLGMRRARAHQAYCSVFFEGSQARARDEFAMRDLGEPWDLEIELAKAGRAHWNAVINGPQAAVHRHLARLTDLLESSTSPALWFRFFPWAGVHFAVPGARDLVTRLVNGALAVSTGDFLPLQLQAHSLRAWLLLWKGCVAEARTLIRELQADEQWAGRPNLSRFGSWGLVVIAAAVGGDLAALLAAAGDRAFFAQMQRMERGAMGIVGVAVNSWTMVRSAAESNDANPIEDARYSYWAPFTPLAKARLAWHEHRHQDALQQLRECASTSGDIDRFALDANVRVSLAIAEMRAGTPQAAWPVLEPLVSRVRRSGEILDVLLCGPDLLAELAHLPWPQDVPREELAELPRWALLSQKLQMERTPVASGEAPAPPNGVLSARELEVLTHIAAGDSNKLIARALDLSPHTVKRHVARILDRLDLASRGEAAAWYHRQGSGKVGPGTAVA